MMPCCLWSKSGGTAEAWQRQVASGIVAASVVIAGAIGLAVMVVQLADAQAPPLTPREGASLEAKLTQVFGNADVPSDTPRLTRVSEREVNAYLTFQAASELPIGVTEPRVTLDGDGRASGSAVVDLNAVRNARERTWLDPLGYLRGQLTVTGAGLLQAADGIGTFVVQSVMVGGVPVPKTVLTELVAYYSRTADDPEGFDIDSPFELPYGIRSVAIGRAHAVIVQ